MLEIRDGIVRRVPRPRLPVDEVATFQGYPPDALLAAYGFPEGYDGSGVTIGIMEWGSGYNPVDVASFCQEYGLPPCDIEFSSVDGWQNDGGTSSADEEATLDIEWVHAGAPGAKKRLYGCNSGTTMPEFSANVHKGFQFVLADPDRPQILTVSYGDAEATFGAAACQQWQADIAALQAAGTWVFVSSGDQGALGMHDIYANPPGQRNVDAPASCPAAIGIGGTRLVLTPTRQETVGGDSGFYSPGGGISSIWARPAYQNGHMAYGRRGVPDLAANADPVTGYAVVFQGVRQVIGGTSASAPFVAALFARILQAMAKAGVTPPKDPHDVIYQNPQAFRDITAGNNSFMGVTGYSAGPGWDACTGMGVPIGTALLAAFVPQQEAPAPEPVKPEPVEPTPEPAPVDPAPVEAKPAKVMVGVDSNDTVTDAFLQEVQHWLGIRPHFWGRYLDTLTPQEVARLLSWGIGILPISRYATATTVATAEDAQAIAARTVAAARELGIPSGTTIPVDVEYGWPVTAAFLDAWTQAVEAADYGPAAYLGTADQDHMTALAGMNAALRDKLAVYAAHDEVGVPWPDWRTVLLFWRRISTPPWATDLPAGTGVWQFAIDQMGGLVDLDLLDATATPGVVLWEG